MNGSNKPTMLRECRECLNKCKTYIDPNRSIIERLIGKEYCGYPFYGSAVEIILDGNQKK